MENEKKPAPHTMMLEGRRRARLTGVMAVSCFNEREVVLRTSEGELALLGDGLHIGELNLEEGRLDVTGDIAGLEYGDSGPAEKRRGLFQRRKK